MTEKELVRPKMKVDAAPLTEADKYNFLPYIDRQADILPSEVDSWKTDALAQALMKAIERGDDLTQTDWTGVNLKGADLSGVDLSGVKLQKANLTGTCLQKANLENADLSYAYMENTDLSDARMKGVQVKGVFYKNCKLDGADIEPETLLYLQSLEWFLEQIEKGKIDLKSIPQDQLNYLDLRTIDLSQVDATDVDLSAIVLTGVNLSGVRIDKRHFLNMALFEKEKEKFERQQQLNEQAAEILLQKMASERAEQLKAYAASELHKQQTTRTYKGVLERPKKKENLKKAPLKKTEDIHSSAGKEKDALYHPSEGAKVVDRQKQKVRVQKTQLKKRA